MLSQETASGKFPVESVQMMRQIADMTERHFPYDLWRTRRRESFGRGKPT
jgi:pyruvate kinase